VVNIGLSLLFIQYWGIYGVAMATVIAYALDKGVLMWFVRRKMQFRLSQYQHLPMWLGYSLLLVAVFVVMEWWGKYYFGHLF